MKSNVSNIHSIPLTMQEVREEVREGGGGGGGGGGEEEEEEGRRR